MKTIGYTDAMQMLKHPTGTIRINDEVIPAVQIGEDFILVSVPGGSNGSSGGQGDWIAIGKDGRPWIVTNHVVWSHGGPVSIYF